MHRRRGDYGIDAPAFLYVMAAIGVVALMAGLAVASLGRTWWAAIPIASGLWLLVQAAFWAYTTRSGKFAVWAEILASLGLRGDERVLDMGCGRGAVLLMAAELLPTGRAVGVDLWMTRDQSGNSIEAARRNAELEGVADRVEVHTADMRDLPFAEASFDVVVSSLAIHNIPRHDDRLRAISEAVRVLRPGGRLAIVDIAAIGGYMGRLRQLGMRDVSRRLLDWRFWYGGPWTAGRLVTARKP